MAFSAQTDHGQCERKDTVLCEIGKETSKEKTKVCVYSVAFHVGLICVLYAIFCIQNFRGRDCIIHVGALAGRGIGGFMV